MKSNQGRYTLLLLLLFISTAITAQVKPVNKGFSFVLNDSFVVINGTAFSANKMLADPIFKVVGQPTEMDTLSDKSITNINFLEMARMNKYPSAGVMFKQGRQTSRINEISLFLNPDPAKQYLDYVNTGYKGKLTVLGLKIDSNTTVKQLQAAFAKYDLSVMEEFKVADMTIFDKKSTARLLEIKFRLTKSLQKIEYIEFRYYPNEPVRKLKMEYRDKQLYLEGLLLDTASGRTTALKKILGAPDGIFDYDYRMGSRTIKVKEYLYRNIKGVSFIENPNNNSLIYLKMDFLSLRKKSDLANPVISLVINGKPFNPEQPVERSQREIKTIFGFDSTGRVENKSDKKAVVTAYDPNANLGFEFDGDLDWYKRVYYFSYYLKQPAEPPPPPKKYPAFAAGDITPEVNKDISYIFIATDEKSNLYTIKNRNYKSYTAHKYDGTAWSDISPAPSGWIGVYDCKADAAGNLYVYARLNNEETHLYKYTGGKWDTIPTVILNGSIRSVYLNKKNELYVRGKFSNEQGSFYLAKYKDNKWTAVGQTMNNRFIEMALKEYSGNDFAEDGSGNIYVDIFRYSKPESKSYIAIWNANGWSLMDTVKYKMDATIPCLAVTNKGTVYFPGFFKNEAGDYSLVKGNTTTGWEMISTKAPGFEPGYFESVALDQNDLPLAAGWMRKNNTYIVAKWNEGKGWETYASGNSYIGNIVISPKALYATVKSGARIFLYTEGSMVKEGIPPGQ